MDDKKIQPQCLVGFFAYCLGVLKFSFLALHLDIWSHLVPNFAVFNKKIGFLLCLLLHTCAIDFSRFAHDELICCATLPVLGHFINNTDISLRIVPFVIVEDNLKE
ncbi:hypothetical protein ACJX0J_038456 [Zea mays]